MVGQDPRWTLSPSSYLLQILVVISWLAVVWVVSLVSSILMSRVIVPFWTRDELISDSLHVAKRISNATSNGLGSVLLILSIPLIGFEGGLTMIDLILGWIILTILHYLGTHFISKNYHAQLVQNEG